MPTLTPSDEAELTAAVKAAVAMTADDESPDVAIEKLARDRGLMPGQVRLVCAAYNTGRQIAQMKANQTAMDKFAAFPLADADCVLARLYPAYEKAAFVPEAEALPVRRMTKAAETVAVEPKPLTAVQIYNQAERLEKKASEARRKHVAVVDKIASDLGILVDRMRRTLNPGEFKKFARALETYHGGEGQAVATLLLANIPNVKRAAADEPVFGSFDQTDPLFKSAVTLIDLAKSAFGLDREKRAAETEVREFRERYDLDRPYRSKTAGTAVTAAAVGATTKTLLDRLFAQQSTGDMVRKNTTALDDPGHNNALRTVQAQSMLSSLMTDPNEPISGYDPNQVLSAYNELAELTPRGSTHLAVMRPLLRRRLEGKMEPFETGEITKNEQGLRDLKALPAPKTESPKPGGK